jgi:hypothetical protein
MNIKENQKVDFFLFPLFSSSSYTFSPLVSMEFLTVAGRGGGLSPIARSVPGRRGFEAKPARRRRGFTCLPSSHANN